MKNFKALAAGLLVLGAFVPTASFADPAETKFQYDRVFSCSIAAQDAEVDMNKTGDDLSGSTTLTVSGDTALAELQVEVDKVTLPAGSAVVKIEDNSSSSVEDNKDTSFIHTDVDESLSISAEVTGATATGTYEIPVSVTCAEA